MRPLNPDFMKLIRPILELHQRRLGSKNDGGYVLPEVVLSQCDFLISLGYGNNADFEKDFLSLKRQNRVTIYESSIEIFTLIKALVRSIFEKLKQQRSFPFYQFKCLVLYLLLRSNFRIRYFNMKVVGAVDESSRKEIALSSILNSIRAPENTILKIDIEGSEYECLASALDFDKLHSLPCIVIEFHDICDLKEMFERIQNRLFEAFCISNVHINNYGGTIDGVPNVLEIVYINNKLSSSYREYVASIPSPLDRPCNPFVEDISYEYSDY